MSTLRRRTEVRVGVVIDGQSGAARPVVRTRVRRWCMAHRHPHAHPHRSLLLGGGAAGRSIHRIGRRQFLADLGRNTVAVAVLGGAAAACSGDDDADSADEDDGTRAAVDEAPAPAPSATDELRWAQANLGFVSAYVLVRGSEALVVDTGQSGSVDAIGQALGTVGATYDDVRHVVLTHSHPDHVGSLSGVLDATDGATAYAGADDIADISSPVDVVAAGDGDDILGLQVISTPGHTPGSISLLDPGIGLLVAGDALNGSDDGTALLGPNERFTADMTTAAASVRKLAGREIEIVAPGHGQPVDTDPGSSFDSILRGLTDAGLLVDERSEESSGG